eukprot:6449294-Alexandrium_andersonii.AAC.1
MDSGTFEKDPSSERHVERSHSPQSGECGHAAAEVRERLSSEGLARDESVSNSPTDTGGTVRNSGIHSQ